jgi:Na+-translocating ferredoxin:NAD+ oxidoreductase subunit D
MNSEKKFIVSHAPFWHDGSSISERSYHTMFAALPAVLFGLFQYGWAALAVISLSVSTAIIWELLINKVSKRPNTIGDGNAALIGLLFAMLMPAGLPWWIVITGTFIAVVIGKFIFGGIGSNPFNPVVLSVTVMMVSWKPYFDFDAALVNFDFGFMALYPLAAVKQFGLSTVEGMGVGGLLMGQQIGGIGATFGLGLIVGGVYLILRGFIRWEISVSFLAGIFITAMLFNMANPEKFAGPLFHLFTGYTLIGAFFLATEDSSSPVNFVPMLIYGAGAGVMAMLIRNIGAYVDGVLYAILVMNLVNPLLDKIRPKAIGKVA